jgi:putative membrane protein
MFVDYLTLLMINLAAGTALLAYYVYKGVDAEDSKSFAAGFLIVGLIAFLGGAHMVANWPLPGSYNIGFGESTVLFGAVFLGAALAISQGWSLLPVAIYALFAGVEALLVGLRIIDLGLTKSPLVSGIGFILAGAGGIAAAPGLGFLKKSQTFRYIAVASLILVSAFWAFTFYNSLWGHLESFASYVPARMIGK